MQKEIMRYPTPPSVEYATDVRVFDENIVALIEDMRDTIEANTLEGLAAFQIASHYNIVVIKNEDGSLLEMINPRVVRHEGKQTNIETTAYFPNLHASVQRHDKISVVYQDREGKDAVLKVDGVLSATIQRKIDYTFGSSFLPKLTPEEKKRFELQLEFGSDIAISESCPTSFNRDKILKVINISMLVMSLIIGASLFIQDKVLLGVLWSYQLYASFILLTLNIGYFFYAQYEGKKYTSCTSCQIGNIIGTSIISLVKLSMIMIVSYFLVNPS